MDRRWDSVFPARVRLYLYLQYRSHRGAKEVRLTNDEAGKLGLAKQNKMRDLRWLEARWSASRWPYSGAFQNDVARFSK